MTQFPFIPPVESRELAADIQALFDDLSASLDPARHVSGECHPGLDVFEDTDRVEVVVDLCGVAAASLRILFRSGVLLIVGEKSPGAVTADQTYHLVEREFGRFSRAVKLNGAFEVSHASARLRDGELIVVLPKLLDRRGQAHHIPITNDGPKQA